MYKKTGDIRFVQDKTTTDYRLVSIDSEEYKKWIAEDNTPEPEFTDEELLEQENTKKIAEAKQYLNDTDFYMTIDKYATLTTERQEELTQLRAEARALINSLEGDE